MSAPALRGPSSWVPALSFEWRDPWLRVEANDDEEEAEIEAEANMLN